MSSTYLSGSVGFTLLELNTINVLLFADIHDGIEYCKQDSTMIAEWLNKMSSKNNILLEEIIRERFILTDLWPNSKHTQELKQLKNANEKIIPIDIRPKLIPFSWEVVGTNNILGQMRLDKYINDMVKLFNMDSEFYIKYLKIDIETMELKQSTFSESKVSPLIHFNELKEILKQFILDNKDLLNKNIIYISKNNIKVLYEINNLISMIMEWYIILLIHNNTKNTIIHVGLAHSNRLLDLLVKVYRFKIIKQSGINQMREIPNNIPSSCIMLPPDVTNMYNRKYGFNIF